MREYELGKEGEQQARILLKKLGFQVQSPDWIAKKDGKWTCFEIKKKERFMPPPFAGHGLDEKQIFLRNEFFKDTDIRTYLIIFEVGTENIFGQFIDILEKGNKFRTKNGIWIFPLSAFRNLKKFN